MVVQQAPDVLAMLFADDIHRETASGKFSILGTYDTVAAPSFPWTLPALIMYLALTDGRGQTPMTIRLVDVDELRPPIFESQATIDFSDPLSVVEMAFFETNVLFPGPGEYRVQLFAFGQFIRERRLLLIPLVTNGLSP